MNVEQGNFQRLRNGGVISLWDVAAEAANGGQLRVRLYVAYEGDPYQTVEFVHAAPEVLNEGPWVVDLGAPDPN